MADDAAAEAAPRGGGAPAGEPRLRLAGATAADQQALWLALYYASHMDEEAGRRPADACADPGLRRYVAGWGRPGDLALLAEDVDGRLLGGAWLRLLIGDERHGPEFVDAETPELGIAVLPPTQGRGIGSRLLGAVIDRARGRYPAIVLTVREGNPARRLYERFGFAPIGAITNRVGGRSCKMLLALAREASGPGAG